MSNKINKNRNDETNIPENTEQTTENVAEDTNSLLSFIGLIAICLIAFLVVYFGILKNDSTKNQAQNSKQKQTISYDSIAEELYQNRITNPVDEKPFANIFTILGMPEDYYEMSYDAEKKELTIHYKKTPNGTPKESLFIDYAETLYLVSEDLQAIHFDLMLENGGVSQSSTISKQVFEMRIGNFSGDIYEKENFKKILEDISPFYQ